METAERVKQLLIPEINKRGLNLYDIELASGILRVTVDRDGGIDLDAIGEASKTISRLLDEEDVISGDRYLLEVTSPGVERRLRLPEHFIAAVGCEVRVRLRHAIDGVRRFDGRLMAANEVAVEIEFDGVQRQFDYDDVQEARTIYDWDAALSAKRDDSPQAEVDLDLDLEEEDAALLKFSEEEAASNKKATSR